MDNSTEVKLIQVIYDRIFDIVTYTPGGNQAPVFDAKTTLIQVVPLGLPINPTDLANAASPINPNGSLLPAEVFYDIVNPLPLLNANYEESTFNLSQMYDIIINGANATEKSDPNAQKTYEEAYNYLNQTTSITDYTGKTTTQTQPTPIYNTYQNNQSAYMTALGAYRSAFNNYDLTDPKQQREWQANSPALTNTVNQTWNTWRMQGAAQVEQALDAINTSLNSAVRYVLSKDQSAFTQAQLSPQVTGGSPWYLCYALPSNWADPTATNIWSTFKLSTSQLNASADSNFTKYGGGVNLTNGLWSVGGSFGHEDSSTQSHTEATDLNISMEICVVQIHRPWFDASILSMGGWNMGDAYKKGGISTGSLNTDSNSTPMPLIPTAFIAARNVVISGNWSAQDQTHIQSATSGGMSVGWGPFQISGNYATGNSHDTFQSNFQNGGISVPGIQIIAFVNQITPLCPPDDKH